MIQQNSLRRGEEGVENGQMSVAVPNVDLLFVLRANCNRPYFSMTLVHSALHYAVGQWE